MPIAVAGALGYLINGWSVAGLPEWSLGYVYLPALVLLSLLSSLTAPIGARLAHKLPVATLKRCFALFILAMEACAQRNRAAPLRSTRLAAAVAGRENARMPITPTSPCPCGSGHPHGRCCARWPGAPASGTSCFMPAWP